MRGIFISCRQIDFLIPFINNVGRVPERLLAHTESTVAFIFESYRIVSYRHIQVLEMTC